MPAQRDDLIDALRGFALLGVFAVNFSSYVDGFEASVIGRVEPASSPWAALAHGTVGALFEAKSYPLLAFLVGYSLALQLRTAQRRGVPRARAVDARWRRTARQLGLGVVHGTFLYYGDILTAYALMTFGLIAVAARPLRGLRTSLAALAVIIVLVRVGLTMHGLSADDTGEIGTAAPLGDAPTVWALIETNAQWYLDGVWGLTITVPWLGMFAGLGLLAGRVRWLERPDHWSRAWVRLACLALPIGAALNVGVGALSASAGAARDAYGIDLAENLATFVGPILSAGIVGLAATLHHRGAIAHVTRTLAPLGRNSLSAYVTHSLLMQALFGGPWLALGPSLGSVGLLAVAVATWCAMLVIAARLDRTGRRGPLEGWMARA